MRVAMTGGGGFVGSHLLARMVGSGMDVTLIGPNLGRSRYTASLVTAGTVRFIRCDSRYRAGDDLLALLEDVDALVLLGYVAPPGAAAAELVLAELECNVAPLARLLSASVDRGRHVVFASSDSVYGVPVRTPVRESDAPYPQTAFGVAKLACEQTVRICCSAAGATASILRYSTVYGPGETAPRPIPNLISEALAGRAPVVDGDALNENDYIHVADAVDATMSALRRKADGVYNVATGIGTTRIELANLVVWLAGSKLAPVTGSGGESAHGRVSLVLDTERLRSELDFVSRHSLPEGLTEEIGWFRAQLGGTLTPAA